MATTLAEAWWFVWNRELGWMNRMFNSAVYNFTVGSLIARSSEISPDEALYLKALEVRNFEIEQLVQRNNFFMVFQGVLLAGVLQSEGKTAAVSAAVCFAGLLVSVAQYRMAAGAKYWQQKWESQLMLLEGRLRGTLGISNFHDLFLPKECKREVGCTDDVDSCRCDQCLVSDGLSKSSFIERRVNSLVLRKPSVSRIPIFVGILLTLTWAFCGLWFSRLALAF